MTRYLAKIGAVFYILWGILHVGIGALVLYRLATEGGVAALAQIGTAVPAANLPEKLPDVAGAVLGQHAWNLILFGLFATAVGTVWNWQNSRLGYWLNLTLVSGADLGFIIAIVLPRYNTFLDGLAGPVLWLLAVIFSTLGILRSPTRG